MLSPLKSAAAAVALLASASALAAVPSSPITPTSPASPTAGDNGSLLLIVYDDATQRSIVEDLSLTISQIQPADMSVPGTVLDFGSINLSLLNGSSASTTAAHQHYLVVGADYQQNPTGPGSGFNPFIYSGAGNNLYVTSGVGNYNALSDAGKIEQSASIVSDYLANVFNSAARCDHANPCVTAADNDARYFGTPTPCTPTIGGPLCPPPAPGSHSAELALGSSPYGAVGTALSFWALNVIGNDSVTDGVNSNTISKTQYAGQFLLDSSGHLTYTVSSVPLPAAGWLLISGLLGLGTIGRRRSETATA